MLSKFKCFLVLVFALVFIFSAVSTADARDEPLTFQWDQEITSDFAGWKLYKSLTSGGPYDYAATIEYVSEQTVYTSDEVIETPDNQAVVMYFVMRAFDTAGNPSENSNEVSHEFDFDAPPAPFSLIIVVR